METLVKDTPKVEPPTESKPYTFVRFGVVNKHRELWIDSLSRSPKIAHDTFLEAHGLTEKAFLGFQYSVVDVCMTVGQPVCTT